MAAPPSTFFFDFLFWFPPLMAAPPLQNLRQRLAELHRPPPVRTPPRRSGHCDALFSPCASQNRSNFSATQTNVPIQSQCFGTERRAHSCPSQDQGPWLPKGRVKASGRFLGRGTVP